MAPTTAPELGKSLSDPIQMYLGDIYTISVNLAGLPGISVPCGRDDQGLPIGLQLIGDCFKEHTLIRTAYTYEQARGAFGVPEDLGENSNRNTADAQTACASGSEQEGK